MAGESYLEIIERCGGRRETLGRDDRWRLAQCWREVFAAGLYSARGRWKLGKFDWHIFSFGYAPAWKGQRALAAYRDQRAPSFIVCPERADLPGMRIDGGELPDLQVLGDDIRVWPEDLAWTMAFTHETDWGLGPYFCRRERIVPPIPMPGI